jgi:hypothetical protein
LGDGAVISGYRRCGLYLGVPAAHRGKYITRRFLPK